MLLPLLALITFSASLAAASPPAASSRYVTLQLMFYNVENLFDTQHDQGRSDWEFLPLAYPGKRAGCASVQSDYFRKRCLETDWQQSKLAVKLEQIRKVVLHKRRPDLLGLCEVENAAVLKRLAAQLGYSHHIITDGADPRGIDVALLYNGRDKRFTYQRHRAYRLQTGRHLQKPTRDILEVEFRLANGEYLVVYVVHWPSQRSPSEARMVAARRTVELVREQQRRNPRVSIVVLGDFNVIDADHPHPFRDLFDSRLFDVQSAFMQDNSIAWERRRAVPLGTYFYPPRMSWNRLDRIFYNKNLRDGRGVELDIQSFKVLAYPWLVKTFTYKKPGEFLLGSTVKNVPKRYDFRATSAYKAGYSDHFALSVNLRYPRR